ncbi:hypothetical protein L218DRAFT_1032613 [Marasmius fiardii PR-910]|nr:hypothetical protein L218DRAFT_1032613 [Marasmius fiardii PR-910]
MKLFTPMGCYLLVVVVGTVAASPLPVAKDDYTTFAPFGHSTGTREVHDQFVNYPHVGLKGGPVQHGLTGIFGRPLDPRPVSSNVRISYSPVSCADAHFEIFKMRFEQKSIEISNMFREAFGMPLIQSIQPIRPFKPISLSSHAKYGDYTSVPPLQRVVCRGVIGSHKDGDGCWHVHQVPMLSPQDQDQRSRELVRQALQAAHARSGYREASRESSTVRGRLGTSAQHEYERNRDADRAMRDRLRQRARSRSEYERNREVVRAMRERLEQRIRSHSLQGPPGGHEAYHRHRHGLAVVHQELFMARLQNALMSLGPWEGKVVIFVLGWGIGSLIGVIWMFGVVVYRAVKRSKNTQEEADGDLRLEGPETAGVKNTSVALPSKTLVEKKAEGPVAVGDDSKN